MKTLFLFCFSLLIYSMVHAQASTADSVKAAVNLLFDGMRASDSATITRSFTDSAILQTIITNADGKTIIRNEAVKEFAVAINKIAKGAADERIVFETIKTDGALASVWTPYSFFFNGKFSHCGVDSYQLVRQNGVWKIQYLIDTRRKQPCTP
jgi:hypothetical protein